jgi:hypothetical protein
MGIWVQACCTASVEGALDSIGTLFDSLDFAEIDIELGGIDGFSPIALRDSLKIERSPKLPPPLDVCWFSLLHGSAEANNGCSWDRLTDSEHVNGSVNFLRDKLPDEMSSGSAAQITTVLTQTVEIVQTRLGDSASGTLGGIIAQETGRWLANFGAGLLVIEHDWWIDPQTGEPMT